MTYTTPWFWNTPEGGGWVRYWQGAFVSAFYARQCLENGYTRAMRGGKVIDVPLSDAERSTYTEALADCPRRDPTTAEKRAWRKYDPPADGQTDHVEGAGQYEVVED